MTDLSGQVGNTGLKSCPVATGPFSGNPNKKPNGWFVVEIDPRFVEADNAEFY